MARATTPRDDTMVRPMEGTTMTDDTTRRDTTPDAGLTGPGEYAPAGEAQGQGAAFTAEQVAGAFGVGLDRVHAAMAGELDLDVIDTVDSQQAQLLAEVLLGDQPLDRRQAALMELGAFTPRSDHEWGSGETAPDEESDRLQQRGLERDEDR
jgi:hypothetical protein